MSWLTALPKGLSHQDCERGDPTKFGGEPPIRFVYSMPEPEDAESRKSTVNIKFDNSEQYFSQFRGGNGEQAVRHMRAFNELVKKKKKKAEEKKAREVAATTATTGTVTQAIKSHVQSSQRQSVLAWKFDKLIMNLVY